MPAAAQKVDGAQLRRDTLSRLTAIPRVPVFETGPSPSSLRPAITPSPARRASFPQIPQPLGPPPGPLRRRRLRHEDRRDRQNAADLNCPSQAEDVVPVTVKFLDL